MVIALNKKILLLDEALSGMDIERAEKVLNYLSNIEDLSIIFISHDNRHIGVGDFKRLVIAVMLKIASSISFDKRDRLKTDIFIF